MSTNRFFWIWAVRSRVMVFLGLIIGLIPFWSEFIGQLEHAGLISLFGMVLAVLGVMDGFGLIQRNKVKLAIQARDRVVRGLTND